MNQSEYDTVLSEADCLYTDVEVRSALDRLATEITTRLQGTNPLVLSIMNGGLVTTGQLLTRLTLPLELGYVHATRYRNQTQGDELQWLQALPDTVRGRTVLLVDDILDIGITLRDTVKACVNSGASEVWSAVLVKKQHDRNIGFEADFVGMDVADRYVFGYGMDYHGYLRNANGIFAVRGL